LLKLATSRDLTNWSYIGNRSTFIEPSHLDSGAYDTMQMLGPSEVIVRGEELWMFCRMMAFSVGSRCRLANLERIDIADTGEKYRSGSYLAPADEPDDPDQSAIHLATLRIDGKRSSLRVFFRRSLREAAAAQDLCPWTRTAPGWDP